MAMVSNSELMVVSGNPRTRETLRGLMTGTGMDVVVCEDEAQCFDHLDRYGLDVIAVVVDLEAGSPISPDLIGTLKENWGYLRIVTLHGQMDFRSPFVGHA